MTPDEAIEPHALVHRLESDEADTTESLKAIRDLRSWLDELEGLLVPDARVEGLSWQSIATALGRTKQSIWEKYRDADPEETVNG
jgi:hypothetical protein